MAKLFDPDNYGRNVATSNTDEFRGNLWLKVKKPKNRTKKNYSSHKNKVR